MILQLQLVIELRMIFFTIALCVFEKKNQIKRCILLDICVIFDDIRNIRSMSSKSTKRL